MKKTIVLLLILVIAACSNNKKKDKVNELLKPESTGRINEVVVVVSDEHWKGIVGDAFVEILSDPIPGLPQPEYVFNITTTPPKAFEGLFKRSRNLIVLQLSAQTIFKVTKSKYARPQTIVQLKAKTEKELVALILDKKNEVINAFRNEDLKSVQKEHRKKLISSPIKTLTALKIGMEIPNKYKVVMDTLNSFMWLRSHIDGGIAKGDQTNNLLAYKAPMFNAKSSILDQVIKNRNAIGKRFIRGSQVDKMYMITEAARIPTIKEVNINGYKAYETRGTWEVFGAFNAGPFINYSIVDKENKCTLVVEGFNYAPSVNKRNFMFELEAILKTTKILN